MKPELVLKNGSTISMVPANSPLRSIGELLKSSKDRICPKCQSSMKPYCGSWVWSVCVGCGYKLAQCSGPGGYKDNPKESLDG